MEQKDQFKKDAKAFNNCAFVHDDNKYLRFFIIYANNIVFQVCISKKMPCNQGIYTWIRKIKIYK